ncbi:MAG: DUF2141 domain-containing protein [Candidatus Eremiobacteraeota bacterium]|nr:DUF2141 domain-containing protein [Candidatus Eremiobacteraeota bacterium]
MRMRGGAIFMLIFLLCLATLAALAADRQEGSITINAEGFRNDKGEMKGALFSSADGFPYESGKALKTFSAPISEGHATATIDAIPYGTYAISLYHDDDSSGKLERGAWGKPKKGIGISNNPPKRNRAPRFDEGQFTLGEPRKSLPITMIYY